jgi:ketosteroid isomerase-like protein
MSTPEPQRLINARQFFLSYSKDRVDDALRLLAPDVVYSVPGNSPISGVFHGPEEVRRHIVKLLDFSRGTFEVLKWIDWVIGETHVAALQYAQAQTHFHVYRGHHIYLVEFNQDDLLSAINIFFEDQAAADRFFGEDI